MNVPHLAIEPSILYFGTPVILIGTTNEDGSYNLAPMSSAFWLGWRCMLGLNGTSKTPQNMLRTSECVLNLPSVDQVAAVNKLARLTGSDPIPESKQQMGYAYEKDKFGIAGLTPVASETVAAPRVLECPIQLEAVVSSKHHMMEDDAQLNGFLLAIEVRITRVHVHPDLLLDGHENRIDSDKWKPLIMSFQKFYGLTGQVHDSTLARIPESAYRMPDIDRARAELS